MYHYFSTAELFFKLFYLKKKINFAQCCFRAYLLMFQNDWKALTLVQRGFKGQIVDWESVKKIFHNLASLACILEE